MSTGGENRSVRIGAVAYDPKVVTIWEGFKAYFDKRGFETDFILYSNYDAQVDANLKGEIDIGPEFFEPLPEEELKAWEGKD